MNIFWGMKILWIRFGVKIGLYFGINLCILGSFLKVKVHNGDIFLGGIFLGAGKISIFGMLEIPDIFGGER